MGSDLVERLRYRAAARATEKFPQETFLEWQAAARITELEAALSAATAELEMLKADFNDCNSERARHKAAREAAEAEAARLREVCALEQKRSAELLKRLDKALEGKEPDFCYDPAEWEFTSSWDERNQVIADGDALPLGGIMQIATLLRGPRKWVVHVPITWDEDGDPDDTEIRWFDSEEEARAALGGEHG